MSFVVDSNLDTIAYANWLDLSYHVSDRANHRFNLFNKRSFGAEQLPILGEEDEDMK